MYPSRNEYVNEKIWVDEEWLPQHVLATLLRILSSVLLFLFSFFFLNLSLSHLFVRGANQKQIRQKKDIPFLGSSVHSKSGGTLQFSFSGKTQSAQMLNGLSAAKFNRLSKNSEC